MIARVCREAREVVLENGQELEIDDVNGRPANSPSIWIQPRRDDQLLNWTRWRFALDALHYGFPGLLPVFLFSAADLGTQPIVVADVLHPFILDQSTFVESPHISWDGADANQHDVRDIADCCESEYLDVIMAAVSLHITPEAALESGLFGLLGDAPVQTVSVGDDARLRRFHALYREHALDKEPSVDKLFEKLLCRCEFRGDFLARCESWCVQAEWLILAFRWQRARNEKASELELDPGSVWQPALEERDCILMEEYSFNDDHPWVKQAKLRVPKLRPRIMVRWCMNECYDPARLPRGF